MFRSVLFALLFSAAALANGDAFLNISFDEALSRAQKENKLVFIDFYTTWCGPCKIMAKTTFKDEKVIAWLHEHTIPVSIDAEAQVDIAARYKIKAYPTLVFLNTDGSLRYSMVGSRKSDEFLSEANSALEGKSADQVAAEQIKAQPNNPFLKMSNANRLILAGKKDEGFVAMKDLLEEAKTGQSEVKPPMIYSLMTRIDSAEAKAFFEKEYNELSGRVGEVGVDIETIQSFDILSQVTKHKGILAVYDELKAAGADQDRLAIYQQAIIPGLKKEHRYAEIDAISPIESRFTDFMEKVDQMQFPEGAEEMKKSFITEGTYDHYEMFLGVGKTEQADKIAADMIAKYPEANTYNGLAWSAYEAGKVNATSLEYAKKANDLTEGKNGAIIDTYARVLAALGQNEQAISVVKEGMTKVPQDGREMKFLKECLEELESAVKKKDQT